VKTGLVLVVPLKISVLGECWRLIEKHHIYEADAIQIASAKYVNAIQFLSSDRELCEIAREEGLNSLCLE